MITMIPMPLLLETDQDGVLTADDCDDNDPSDASFSDDCDQDGFVITDDCDDNDSSLVLSQTMLIVMEQSI